MNTNSTSMEERKKAFLRLQAFYSGELSAEEAGQFVEELDSSPLLQQEATYHEWLAEGLEEHWEHNLESQLRQRNSHPTTPLKSKWFRVASVVILVLTSAVGLYQMLVPTLEEALFADHFQPPEGLPVFAGVEDDFRKAATFYKDQNWDCALQVFQGLLKKDEYQFNDTLLFYLGICELATQDWESASLHLQEVSLRDSSTWQAEAQWFLALGHLAAGKEQLLERQLDLILANPRHIYLQEARELADKIRPPG